MPGNSDKNIGPFAFLDLDVFTKKVTGILKKQRPADVQDLLNPGRTKDAYPNVTVGYFNFPTWLTRFDPKLIRPLDVNIHSYRYQRDKYAEDVELELIKIRMKSSGIALMREIEATRRGLSILPYWNFSLFSSPLFPARGFNALTSPAGFAKPGMPGTNATVFFLSYMWGPQGTSGISGPGSNPDEILFHEMIHAGRQMRGVFKNATARPGLHLRGRKPRSCLDAEKKQTSLRTDDEDFIPLPHPEAFLKKAADVTLLQNFRGNQQAFFDALAAIPAEKAWWNPVRDLK